MFGQVAFLREGSLTSSAFKWLFTCVHLEVVKNIPGLSELFAAPIIETGYDLVHSFSGGVICVLGRTRMLF